MCQHVDPGILGPDGSSMYAFIGLGNPGIRYVGTRHNAGFDIIDTWLQPFDLEISPVSDHFNSVVTTIGETKVALIKPMTFMNRSGEAVAPLARWAGAPPADVMVVYDDLDLPLGALRIRPGGGAGGHNGVRSLIDLLGTDRFPRLRVGIGRPATDAARYVLERFSDDERPDVDISVAEAAVAAFEWLRTGDTERVMARFHSRWTQGESSPDDSSRA